MPRADEWGQTQARRGRLVRLLPDREILVASPEDVVIGKLWYYGLGGGDRHLRDIAGILRVSATDVDLAEIEIWAGKLGYLEIWTDILKKIQSADSAPWLGVP